MEFAEILRWLKEEDPFILEELWQRADRLRAENVGEEVHLRGLVEISNHCARKCAYCGISTCNPGVSRYRMSADEIFESARLSDEFNYGTVVLQAGEDYGLTTDFIAKFISRIKSKFNIAVTLSLGERTREEFRIWREAGADRYLIRFETSNPDLYRIIHPDLDGRPSDRFAILKDLRALGYEVGSGVLIGVPGQTWEDLARDILVFADLDLDMVGVGPYIPHPDTPLGRNPENYLAPADSQVPSSELMAYKVVALTRIVCPKTNLPTTTAVATLNAEAGRELGLARGGNVIMPNLTPQKYRDLYEIYPHKAGMGEGPRATHEGIIKRIKSIGRIPGHGRGASPNFTARAAGRT